MSLRDYRKVQLFPAFAGMNHTPRQRRPARIPVPHVRGDEPLNNALFDQLDRLFPAFAGMNRV